MSEVKRYPLARQRTAYNRDLRKPATKRLAVSKLFSASPVSKIVVKASKRGKGMRANGINAQNTTDKAPMIASVQRFKPGEAGVVARNVFDPVDKLRSFTSLLR
jgi:hypothetical protein